MEMCVSSQWVHDLGFPGRLRFFCSLLPSTFQSSDISRTRTTPSYTQIDPQCAQHHNVTWGI